MPPGSSPSDEAPSPGISPGGSPSPACVPSPPLRRRRVGTASRSDGRKTHSASSNTSDENINGSNLRAACGVRVHARLDVQRGTPHGRSLPIFIDVLASQPGDAIVGRASKGSARVVVGTSRFLKVLDPGVSARHLALRLDAAGGVEVRDLGSSNGTFLNDVKLPFKSAARDPLRPGDSVRMGKSFLAVERIEPLDASVASPAGDPIQVPDERAPAATESDSESIASVPEKTLSKAASGDPGEPAGPLDDGLCPICNKSLLVFDALSRQVHMNECLDRGTSETIARVLQEEELREGESLSQAMIRPTRAVTANCCLCDADVTDLSKDDRRRHVLTCSENETSRIEALRRRREEREAAIKHGRIDRMGALGQAEERCASVSEIQSRLAVAEEMIETFTLRRDRLRDLLKRRMAEAGYRRVIVDCGDESVDGDCECVEATDTGADLRRSSAQALAGALFARRRSSPGNGDMRRTKDSPPCPTRPAAKLPRRTSGGLRLWDIARDPNLPEMPTNAFLTRMLAKPGALEPHEATSSLIAECRGEIPPYVFPVFPNAAENLAFLRAQTNQAELLAACKALKEHMAGERAESASARAFEFFVREIEKLMRSQTGAGETVDDDKDSDVTAVGERVPGEESAVFHVGQTKAESADAVGDAGDARSESADASSVCADDSRDVEADSALGVSDESLLLQSPGINARLPSEPDRPKANVHEDMVGRDVVDLGDSGDGEEEPDSGPSALDDQARAAIRADAELYARIVTLRAVELSHAVRVVRDAGGALGKVPRVLVARLLEEDGVVLKYDGNPDPSRGKRKRDHAAAAGAASGEARHGE